MGLLDFFASWASPNDLGCDWFCDGCDALLNRQPGFTTANGSWTCTNCGYCNSVTSNDILSDKQAETMLSFQVSCPKCGGHMARDPYCPGEVWVCESCSTEATDDGYGNLLVED